MQAKYKYEDLLPDPTNAWAEYGTALHKGVEAYDRGMTLAGATNAFIAAWDAAYKRIEFWPTGFTYADRLQMGKDALRSYDEKMAVTKRQVIAVEHEFVVPCGEFELTGFVDSVELRTDKNGHCRLCVVDKKSGVVPSAAALGYDLQFTTYDYASHAPEFWEGIESGDEIALAFAGQQRKLIWSVIKPEMREITAIPRTPADYKRLYVSMRQIAATIEAGTHIPSITAEACGRCPYHEPCGVTIPDDAELGALA